MVGNYNYQPTWITFSRDNKSFYGSQHRNGTLVQWQLPNLKVLRRIRFPKYQSVKLIQIPNADTFLMEARPSSETLVAFAVDMSRETALQLFDHSGANSRMAPLENGKILIATPYSLKISKIPEPSEFQSFSQVLGGIVEEPISATIAPSNTNPVDQQDAKKVACQSFQIEAIGVYEGEPQRPAGYIKINIGKTDLPIKLLLSSYERVIWQLNISSDVKLSEVLLAGSNGSRVEGLDKTRVTYIGGAYAYKESNLSQLNELVRKHTGCSITHFQGAYKGNNFYIGQVTTSETNKIYKHIDEEGNVVFRNY
jgi:hypothetical protein